MPASSGQPLRVRRHSQVADPRAVPPGVERTRPAVEGTGRISSTPGERGMEALASGSRKRARAAVKKILNSKLGKHAERMLITKASLAFVWLHLLCNPLARSAGLFLGEIGFLFNNFI